MKVFSSPCSWLTGEVHKPIPQSAVSKGVWLMSVRYLEQLV